MDEADLVLCSLAGASGWFLPTGGWSWVLSLRWAGPCQELCLPGSCVVRETLSGLPADGRAVSLPWRLVGPIPALESTGCWVMPGLWWESGSVQEGSADKFSPELVMPASQSQRGATAAPCLHRRPSNTSRPGLSRDNHFLPWVLECSRPCVWSPNVGFLFPPVLWDSWGQTPYPSKPDSLGDPPPRLPGLGAWWWGLKFSMLWENFCGIIILQFVTCVGFDFTMIVPLLLACCGFFFVFGCRTFLVGSSIFFVVVNGCSGISCGFSVFVRGGWGLWPSILPSCLHPAHKISMIF